MCVFCLFDTARCVQCCIVLVYVVTPRGVLPLKSVKEMEAQLDTNLKDE